LGDVDLLQQAVIVGARGEAGFGGYIVVDLPDPFGAVDRRVERNVGIAVLGGPDDRLGADNAWDPNPRGRLLQGCRPRVYARGRGGFCRGPAHGLTTRCW